MPFGILFNSQFSISYLPCEDRIFLHDTVHLLTNGADSLIAFGSGQYGVDQFHDLAHKRLFSATGRDSGRTHTDTGGLEGRAAVERNHVLVHRDVGGYQGFLGHLTGQVGELRAQVDQHTVVVRTAGDDLVPFVREGLGHSGGVRFHLCLVRLVFRLQSLSEGYGLGRDHMLQRTTLDTREYGGVQQLRHLLDLAFRCLLAPRILEILTQQDDTATRTPQGPAAIRPAG